MALTISENLPLISLSGNPMKVKISTDNLFVDAVRRPFYTLFLNIYDANNVLIKSMSAEPNDSAYAWFNLAEAFRSLKPTLLHPITEATPVVADPLACKKFYYKLAEGYGIPYTEQTESVTSGNFYVIPGGLPDWYLRKLDTANSTFYDQLVIQNIWLTNQPDLKTIFEDQPEQLRFISLTNSEDDSAHTADLIVERLNHHGVTSTVTLWSGVIYENTVLSVLANVGLCAASDTISYKLYVKLGNRKITSDAEFIIDYAKPDNTRYLFFRNSLGAFDCVALTGKMISELETKTVNFVTPEISKIREALKPGQERSEGIRYLTGSIGWKNDDEIKWLSELLLSETRYLLIEDDELENIIISQDKHQVGNDGFAPKTFNIEAMVGYTDFFFLRSE